MSYHPSLGNAVTVLLSIVYTLMHSSLLLVLYSAHMFRPVSCPAYCSAPSNGISTQYVTIITCNLTDPNPIVEKSHVLSIAVLLTLTLTLTLTLSLNLILILTINLTPIPRWQHVSHFVVATGGRFFAVVGTMCRAGAKACCCVSCEAIGYDMKLSITVTRQRNIV